MKTRIEKIKPLKGSEWAQNCIGELAREIEKTQKKLNKLIAMVNHLVVTKSFTRLRERHGYSISRR